MKTIQPLATQQNFTAVNFGRLDQLNDYVLPLGPDVTLQGKVFGAQALGATGCEFSFQTLVPGQDSGFLHTHKTHEELYFILSGEGLFQVDNEIFPIAEGSVVRVAPDGRRALKNTGTASLTMLCVQYKVQSFTDADSPMLDGIICDAPLQW